MIRCVIGSGGEERGMMVDPGRADKKALFLHKREKEKKYVKKNSLFNPHCHHGAGDAITNRDSPSEAVCG